MPLTIRRLTPDLAEAFFDFFDNRAFSDNSPYYPCYCNAFQLTPQQLSAEVFDRADSFGGGQEGFRLALRACAERMVKEGILKGYLAFDGENAVGWCNANDKRAYVRVGEFDPSRDAQPIPSAGGEQSILSVVCFEIAPDRRGQGIASALLARVCEDAERDGYDVVEAYPLLRDSREPLDFTGPLHLYEKAGFVPVLRDGRTQLMQKALR